MSTLNKYEDGQWKPISSTDASLITSNSPVLREYLGLEENEVPDTEKVMEALIEDSKVLKGNVSWLALHGGGGSGGSGGNVQADGIIYVNYENKEVLSGDNIIKKDDKPLSFTVKAGDSGIIYEWNYTVIFNGTILKSGKINTNETITIVSANLDLPYDNSKGSLSITCTSGLKSIYWNGAITLNLLKIEANTSSESIDVNNLDNSFINITYSSTIEGDYIILINNALTYNVSITDSTMKYTQLIRVSDIYNSDNIGSNTTNISIKNSATGEENSVTIQVVIVSNTIVISSNILSADESKPTSIIYGSNIPVIFTAYLSNASTFDYKITIDNKLCRLESNAKFNSLISAYIPSTDFEYIEGKLYRIEIEVSSTNQDIVTSVYYISFAESSTLEIKTPAKEYLLSDFKAYGDSSYNKTGLWESSCNDYIYYGSTKSTVESSVEVIQDNILSGILLSEKDPTYFRLSNKAYGIVSNYNIDGSIKSLSTIINSKKDLSISLCFKSDYHTDDNRTVLVLGSYNIDSNNEYYLYNGIEVTVHNILIKDSRGSLNIPIEDSEITNLDIVYNSTTHITKVYINGVMTGSNEKILLDEVISNLDDSLIYLGCSKSGNTYFNFADVLYYRLMIYSKALNDYEILLNFLQNLAYTNFTTDGLPDGKLILEGFERNFISYNSTTGEILKSYLWDNSLEKYSVNNFITIDGINSEIKLYTIPLPILYIDLSLYDAWTWNNFLAVDNTTRETLKNNPASEAKFNYYDPNGTNSNILSGSCGIELLGTSTLNDAVKNLNFIVNGEKNSATKDVFIPKKNWCPEDIYTLKADIVDSSHSSNAAIGKFINEVLANTEEVPWYEPHEEALSKFKSEESSFYTTHSLSTTYKPTLKVAVEGFPVFVIIRFSSKESTIDVHSLGIYLFILGRNSEHNLGMKSIKSIKYNNEDIEVDSIPYYKKGCTIEEFDMESLWIEANDNISMPVGVDLANDDLSDALLTAAFWLYNEESLNKLFSVKYGTALLPTSVTGFLDLVRNIAQAPVRLYSSFSVDDKALTYKDYTGGYPEFKYVEGKWERTGNRITLVKSTDDLAELQEYIDLQSSYKYAITELLFGLEDNFCKNMPLVLFNKCKKFILLYYDMDSGLGITNQSDLNVKSWIYMKGLRNNSANLVEEFYTGASDKEAIIGKDNKLFLSLESNLVMAVALGESKADYNSYSHYWVDLRNKLYEKYKNSYDTLADYFVEEYFKPQTEGCGELLFNLTYQAKYIDTESYSKLHGRRISQVRLWLKEHIKFLDSIIQWKPAGLSFNPDNNNLKDLETKTLAVTSYDYYNTINVKTNIPVLITTTNQGGNYKYVSFCEKNKPTLVIYGGGTTTPSISKTISYSDNLLILGDNENPLGLSGFLKINSGTLLGFNDLNLSGCTEFSGENAILFTNTFYNEKSNLSELRSIDLSNTDGGKLLLDLENFTKLTDINISNGCVSSIILPKTPLISLNVTKSIINEYILNKLSLLEESDVSGCYNLKTISITNCERISNVKNIKDLKNLEKITIAGCPKIKLLSISNCPRLTAIEIKLELLLELTINNCPNLNTLIIDGNTLVTLSVETCSTLEIIKFNDETYNNLTNLSLINTSISSILWGTSIQSDYLDLLRMPSLSNISIKTNSKVKAVQFANDRSKVVPLTNPFTGCSNLERIYGNVLVLCSECFKGLLKFSIHGSDLSIITWKGLSVLSGTRVKMPYEIINVSASSLTSDDLYQEGAKVTNMSFANGTSIFYSTNYTIFDIYYALSNLSENCTYCTYMFREGKNTSYGLFDRLKDNNPNRNMFAKCSNVLYFTLMFYGCGNGKEIILYSPSHDDSGNITADDGLFSPMTSNRSIYLMFGGYKTIVDRFVFRRKEGNYALTTMPYFYMHLIVDDVNNTSLITNDINLIIENSDNYGNLSNFFENLTNLEDSNPPNTYGIAGFGSSSLFINYETTENLKIPEKIKQCRNILTSLYAKGEIVLSNLFKSPGEILYIHNSFRVINKIDGLLCTFNINNNILKEFTKLKELGYYTNPSSGLSGSYLTGSLTGDGLTKIVSRDFPYNIFNPCNNTIVHVSGLFAGAKMEEGYSNLILPGSLFENTPNIEVVSGLFYNFDAQFTLSSNGFANCKNLKECAYLFANCTNMSGYIPNKLFYHGEDIINVTRKGANSNEEGTLEDTITILYKLPKSNITTLEGCFVKSNNLEAYEHLVLEKDLEKNPEYYPFLYIKDSEGNWIENDNYNPYEYTYRWVYDGMNKFLENDTYNGKVDYIDDSDVELNTVIDMSDAANYDITRVTIKNGYRGDGGDTADTGYFCCAPDLLRYCKNISTLNIKNLFKDSGNIIYGSDFTFDLVHKLGLKGRIPPYLLKPVSEITDISYMFYGCRALSNYTKVGGKSYVVPRDFFKYASKVSSLEGTFAGMRFPLNIELSVFNNILTTQLLNLKSIFVSSYFDGSESNPAEVSNIFSNYNVSGTLYAFAVLNSTSGLLNHNSVQYVKFSNIFKSGVYTNSQYRTNMNFSYTFAWYNKDAVIHEDQKTLVNNDTTWNYVYSDNTIPN